MLSSWQRVAKEMENKSLKVLILPTWKRDKFSLIFLTVVKLKDQTDSKIAKTESPGASPIVAKDKKRDRVRSRSALGDNVKTLVSEAQKRQEAAKRYLY